MKALFFCAAIVASIVSVSEASALNAPTAQIAIARDGVVTVSHGRRHARGGLFGNWCAYNCYRVSRCARGCFGRYHYSQYAYDQDIPFRYRFDPDASPVDNVLGAIHPYTGEPALQLFERRW